MKIIGIGGSLRQGSYTSQALALVMEQLSVKGIDCEVIDLKKMRLPFCDGSFHYHDYPDVNLLRSQIKSATGILIATPEYHGSFSGVLKNVLDLLDEDQLRGKVVGLIAVVGGLHSTNAINSLRLVFRQLHCWVLPEQVVIAEASKKFTPNGVLIDADLNLRLERMVGHFIHACVSLGSVQQ
jgi:FMN reductase